MADIHLSTNRSSSISVSNSSMAKYVGAQAVVDRVAQGVRITLTDFKGTTQEIIAEAISDITSNADGSLTITLPSGRSFTTASLTGPEGARGEQGEAGIGIESAELNDDYTLTLTFTDGSTYTTPSIRGEQGEKGDKGDTGEVSLAQLQASMVKETVSGDPASFNDGADNFPAIYVKANIEPIQDLNGYDRPWAGGAGKNKVDISAMVSGTGVTKTISGDRITIVCDGTSTYQSLFMGNDAHLIFPAGTYYVKGKVVSNSNTALWSKVGFRNSSNTFVGTGQTLKTTGDFAFSVTTTVDTYFSICCNGAESSRAVTVVLEDLMVSTTDSAYEPYSNICPISGHTEVETVVSPTTSAEDGTTYTTALGRTVYGGTLDVTTGVLTVDRGFVTYDGSSDEQWDVENLSVGKSFYTRVPSAKPSTVDLISNSYEPASEPRAEKDKIYISGSLYLNVSVGATLGLSTVSEWNTYLGTHNLQVVYPLATPQTYQLTAQQINTLLGENNVWASSGEVEVKYCADTALYIAGLNA